VTTVIKYSGSEVQIVSLALLFAMSSLSCAHSQTPSAPKPKTIERKEETPNQRFYRKGGSEIPAQVIRKRYDELTADGIAEGRDLVLYDDGGYFDCRSYYPAKDHGVCDEGKVRDFIWSHWQEKRRCYVRITYSSVDAVSTSHIFVEPNAQGQWHVAWRIVRHSNEITNIPDIVNIELVNGESGKSSYLVFKDNEGDEMQRIPDRFH
jgi:hypothetical protein